MAWRAKKTSVLVPFDFSDACLEAVEVARTFVELDASVTVLHVVSPPLTSYSGLLRSDFEPERTRKEAQKRLRMTLDQEGFKVQALTRVGKPAHEILEHLENVPAELVVIPARTKKGLGRWLLGSVSERVVRHATVPVLVLRDEPSTD